jgi:uroporphyrinogen decarboxylase
MQHACLMSRDLYAEWLKPRLRQVIDAARSVKPDVIIQYHTCGYVMELIPELIEAGIDVLNPVQPECMDVEQVFREFGDALSFNGSLGTQILMPFGTEQDVRDTVKRNLDFFGEKGGLFCCPTHMLEPEAPWENIEAYAEACRAYGRP